MLGIGVCDDTLLLQGSLGQSETSKRSAFREEEEEIPRWRWLSRRRRVQQGGNKGKLVCCTLTKNEHKILEMLFA